MNLTSAESVNLYSMIEESKHIETIVRTKEQNKAIVNIKKFIDDKTVNDLWNLRKRMIQYAQKGEKEFILTQFNPYQKKWFLGKFLWNPVVLQDWKNVIKNYLAELNETLYRQLNVENNVWLEFETESDNEIDFYGGTINPIDIYFIKVRISKYPPKSLKN